MIIVQLKPLIYLQQECLAIYFDAETTIQEIFGQAKRKAGIRHNEGGRYTQLAP